MGDNTNEDTSFNTDKLYQIFTDSNVVIILWFLAVYFIVYLLLNVIRGRDGVKSSLSRWIDIVSLMFLLVYLGFTYFSKSESEKKQIVTDIYSQFKTYLNSPIYLVSIAFFIFTLYIVVYILEVPMDSAGKPVTISILENGAWIMFLLVAFSTFLKYVAGGSLTSFMDNIGEFLKDKAKQASATESPAKASDKSTSKTEPTTAPVALDEVFNIGHSMFTYDDAKSVCASFGARLATYDEIESAYNNGGEWCNYGWSDEQAVYFPTQKSTWKNLQKSESTKNTCGRPGVNGGYIDDPNARFGVNCFGVKPKPTNTDLAAVSASSAGVNVPKAPEDTLLEKKIEFWNANREKLLKINGYNNNKWSMY